MFQCIYVTDTTMLTRNIPLPLLWARYLFLFNNTIDMNDESSRDYEDECQTITNILVDNDYEPTCRWMKACALIILNNDLGRNNLPPKLQAWINYYEELMEHYTRCCRSAGLFNSF